MFNIRIGIVHSIVQNHDGHVDVVSAVGEGSEFRVFLPASDSEPVEAKSPDPVHSTGHGKIMVMDDEAAVRKISGKILERAGYTVEYAANGDEAIELYRQAAKKGDPFDVVVLDLTIRGAKGGEETLNDLLRFDSQVKAIASSGYANSPILSEYRRYGFCAVVRKPYSVDDLTAVVADVMGTSLDSDR